MNIQDAWEKALKQTEIIRPRVQALFTFAATRLSYIALAESSVNQGDTVVRKGEVLVEKPSLILPSYNPQFEGFDFEEGFNPEVLTNFLFIRGVTFPSLRYNNKTQSLDILEGGLKKSVDYYLDHLQKQEDVHTGLVTGPEECWQFSILIFICSQAARQAEGDIQKILEQSRKKNK